MMEVEMVVAVSKSSMVRCSRGHKCA